jgi:hypothetical protein
MDKNSALQIEKEYLAKSPDGVAEFANWLGIPPRNLDTLLLANASDFAQQILTENWRGKLVDSNSTTDQLMNNQGLLIDSDFTNVGKGL